MRVKLLGRHEGARAERKQGTPQERMPQVDFIMLACAGSLAQIN